MSEFVHISEVLPEAMRMIRQRFINKMGQKPGDGIGSSGLPLPSGDCPNPEVINEKSDDCLPIRG